MRLAMLTVSHKTPVDGRLEITAEAAQRLAQGGSAAPLHTLVVLGQRGAIAIASRSCTCHGPDEVHEHYFLESELLKLLPPGTAVAVDFDPARGQVTVG
jgi:hypothetical protein